MRTSEWHEAPVAHGTTGPRAEDESFEQRIAGQAIRAMHARAGHFTRRKQPWDGRPPIEIREHAAHDVVRGGPDRDRVSRQVEAGAAAGLGNQRKTFVHVGRVEQLEREKDRPARALLFTGNRPRDPVPSRGCACADRCRRTEGR